MFVYICQSYICLLVGHLILLGRLFSRFWRVPIGILAYPSKRTFVRSATDGGGQEDLAHYQCSSSHKRCSVGFRSVLYEDHLGYFTANSSSHVFIELALYPEHIHAGKGKGLPQTVTTRLEVPICLKCHCMLMY